MELTLLFSARFAPNIVAAVAGSYLPTDIKDESTISKVKRALQSAIQILPLIFEVSHQRALSSLTRKSVMALATFSTACVSSSSYDRHWWVDKTLRITNIALVIFCFYSCFTLPMNNAYQFSLSLAIYSIQLGSFFRSIHHKHS